MTVNRERIDFFAVTVNEQLLLHTYEEIIRLNMQRSSFLVMHSAKRHHMFATPPRSLTTHYKYIRLLFRTRKVTTEPHITAQESLLFMETTR